MTQTCVFFKRNTLYIFTYSVLFYIALFKNIYHLYIICRIKALSIRRACVGERQHNAYVTTDKIYKCYIFLNRACQNKIEYVKNIQGVLFKKTQIWVITQNQNTLEKETNYATEFYIKSFTITHFYKIDKLSNN